MIKYIQGLFYSNGILFIMLWNCGSSSPTDSAPKENPEQPGWRLVWADEFDYEGLPDSTKWSYDVGGHGWGNNELQFYTATRLENAYVHDGRLFIQAQKEDWQGMRFTSARLVSRNKGDWTFGRFEVRARLPSGRGTWPAIWMLPTEWTYGDGGWPDNGEIDIMEYVGYEKGLVHGSVHTHTYNWTVGTQKTAVVSVPDAESAFHVYAIEWNNQEILFFVDERQYLRFPNEGKGWQTWPFDKAFHLIINLAVGGNWGGAQGVDESIFPQRLEVDYARVYEWKP